MKGQSALLNAGLVGLPCLPNSEGRVGCWRGVSFGRDAVVGHVSTVPAWARL